MQMKKIFIDGKAGTTGLRIEERLSDRNDIEIISLPEELRKDPNARKKALNEADIAFLCLPDEAAREAVDMIENPNVCVIDTSTAHRTNPEWAYGFPELSEKFEKKIKNSKRIAVPGCHAGGFIALIYPLIETGLLSKDILLSVFSLTGYSGGGKKMIGEYESERSALLDSPRQYGISQSHKHLPEMMSVTGIKNAPVFCPVVSDFYAGMEVTVPIFKNWLPDGKTADDIRKIYADTYKGPIVFYKESVDENGFLASNVYSGKDTMEISVHGNGERIILVARYDNLGKGASGAAVECLNIVLGEAKTKTLVL